MQPRESCYFKFVPSFASLDGDFVLEIGRDVKRRLEIWLEGHPTPNSHGTLMFILPNTFFSASVSSKENSEALILAESASRNVVCLAPL